MSEHRHNLDALYRELDWLSCIIDQAVACYLQQDGYESLGEDIPPPELDSERSVYARQVLDWRLDAAERLTLALALAPHLRPEVLDKFFGVNGLTGRGFSEFGGATERHFSGFLPTGQTLVFLLSANHPGRRLEVMRILAPQHRFAAEQLLSLERGDERLPMLAGVLALSDQWLHYLLSGEQVRPELSPAFPASPISTPLHWRDLVLDYSVMAQVDEVRTWLTHGQTLMQDWGLASKVKPGYRTVFHGPPGTGKTLTAALLGKSSGREVYRVDLSMVVSKYIGETEKNLGKVFDVASYKDWILFFDEADALFGKRTSANSSNDRHANQQTGYLLQRIEDFPGTVILATNLKANMDEAFTRRFQSMIHFNMPSAAQRLQLWRNAFDGVCELEADVDLPQLAQDHELAGGAIINVLRYCALNAINRGQRRVRHGDLIEGIKREFRKDNKTIQVARSHVR
ncbi:ATP-binding protein [Pseudomonas sp. MWU13-2105]|uniref:ATP-binding protein n=1 Tax=Pseudomonas sp. MWU13-2105 TaxID=2935074 RepID=UPI00200FF522|nr:ATP-binding protein [Pseudomonas sp. MWU13-2105]